MVTNIIVTNSYYIVCVSSFLPDQEVFVDKLDKTSVVAKSCPKPSRDVDLTHCKEHQPICDQMYTAGKEEPVFLQYTVMYVY